MSWLNGTANGNLIPNMPSSGLADVVRATTNPFTGGITLAPPNGGNIGDFGTTLCLGGGTPGPGKEILNVQVPISRNAAGTNRPIVANYVSGVSPSTNILQDFHLIDALMYTAGSNANLNANCGLYAVEGRCQAELSAGQSLQRLVGVYGVSVDFSSVGTVSKSIGVQGNVQNTGAGATTLGACFYAKSPVVSAGSIDSAYGYYAEDVTQGVSNYSVFTNAGKVRFQANQAVPAGGNAGVGVAISSTADLGFFVGAGAPTMAAAKGSIYSNTTATTTTTRLYVNTDGGTTWASLTTSA